MKIEIEYHEIERLRADVIKKSEEIKKLQDELKANEEHEWEKKAIQLSKNLLDHYFTAIFQKLGFAQDNSWYREANSIKWSDYLGDKWYKNKDKLKINLGLSIWDGVRNAFLQIGVISEEKGRPEVEKTMLSEL